jgi:hypothetical protein
LVSPCDLTFKEISGNTVGLGVRAMLGRNGRSRKSTVSGRTLRMRLRFLGIGSSFTGGESEPGLASLVQRHEERASAAPIEKKVRPEAASMEGVSFG